MTEHPPVFTFSIRSPEAERRAQRRHHLKRAAVVAGLVTALLTPAAVNMVDAEACTHVWVC